MVSAAVSPVRNTQRMLLPRTARTTCCRPAHRRARWRSARGPRRRPLEHASPACRSARPRPAIGDRRAPPPHPARADRVSRATVRIGATTESATADRARAPPRARTHRVAPAVSSTVPLPRGVHLEAKRQPTAGGPRRCRRNGGEAAPPTSWCPGAPCPAEEVQLRGGRAGGDAILFVGRERRQEVEGGSFPDATQEDLLPFAESVRAHTSTRAKISSSSKTKMVALERDPVEVDRPVRMQLRAGRRTAGCARAPRPRRGRPFRSARRESGAESRRSRLARSGRRGRHRGHLKGRQRGEHDARSVHE